MKEEEKEDWSKNIKTMKLSDLEDRIRKSKEERQDVLEKMLADMKNDKSLKKGRVRPRDPAEQEILELLEERRKKRLSTMNDEEEE